MKPQPRTSSTHTFKIDDAWKLNASEVEFSAPLATGLGVSVPIIYRKKTVTVIFLYDTNV